MIILFILLFSLAYLLGSSNSAIFVCKLMRLPDPRSEGSGNPGATNVMRLGGKKAAAIVLIGDVLKGVIPVAIASALGIKGFWLGLIGLAAVTGHILPCFFNFQGGKGVATAMGVIFTLSLWLGLGFIVIFLIVVAITRYVSLGSISAVAIIPLFALFFGYEGLFIPLMVMAILVAWRHKENLERLQAGIENKIRC